MKKPIYPMEKESMRTINFIGNRIFQFIVSFIIGIRLSDSLCGTKVFKKEFIDFYILVAKEFSLIDPFVILILFSLLHNRKRLLNTLFITSLVFMEAHKFLDLRMGLTNNLPYQVLCYF